MANKTVKDFNCLNCEYPFLGNEKFCPECGQKNKGNKLKLKDFVKEVFAGFFSWDAKFWKTLFNLTFKPGKLSKDYIDGKRVRYTNPFRFYITISVIFFLIIGVSKNINKYRGFNSDSSEDEKTVNVNYTKDKKNDKLDSLTRKINNDLKNGWIQLDSTKRKDIIDNIIENAIDHKDKNAVFFGTDSKFDKYLQFYKKYPKTNIDDALDSLKQEKNFINRFTYDRVTQVHNSIYKAENQDEFLGKLLSYGSLSLFIFLPLFTISLSILYLRKRFSYVKHLIFVFHTQTALFILLTIFFFIRIFNLKPEIWIFISIFLIYLFVAIKVFYQEKIFKTFVKFCLLNFFYIITASIGFAILSTLSFFIF